VVENRQAIMGNIFFITLILGFKCYEKKWVFKQFCKKLQFLDAQFIVEPSLVNGYSLYFKGFGNE